MPPINIGSSAPGGMGQPPGGYGTAPGGNPPSGPPVLPPSVPIPAPAPAPGGGISPLGLGLGTAIGVGLDLIFPQPAVAPTPSSSNVPFWLPEPRANYEAPASRPNILHEFNSPIKIRFYSPNNFRTIEGVIWAYYVRPTYQPFPFNYQILTKTAAKVNGQWIVEHDYIQDGNGPNVDPDTIQLFFIENDQPWTPPPLIGDYGKPDGTPYFVPPPLETPNPNPRPTPTPFPDPFIFPQPDPQPPNSPNSDPNEKKIPAPIPAPAPMPTPQPGVGTTQQVIGKVTNEIKYLPPGGPLVAPIPTPVISNEQTPPNNPGTPNNGGGNPPTNLCQDPCLADIQRKAEQSAKTKTITVPLFTGCAVDGQGNKTGNATSVDVPITLPESQAAFAEFLANQLFSFMEKSQCSKSDSSKDKSDCVAAVPEWWEVRVGADRPQLVVQYAEVLAGGKFGAPNYALTIPHYNLSESQTIAALFPNYQKGQKMGVLTLSDNSKLIVNTNDDPETLINALKQTIAPAFLAGSCFSSGVRKGQNLKTVNVAPRIARFFSTGQRNMKPDWIKYFYE